MNPWESTGVLAGLGLGGRGDRPFPGVVEGALANAKATQSGAARAHVVQNKVETAYPRSDPFERRRRLMDDWAAYLDRERRPVISQRR